MKIQNVEKVLSYDSIARLRVIAERGCDPNLYEMAASGFDALEMPAAASSMRRRAEHYRKPAEANNRIVTDD